MGKRKSTSISGGISKDDTHPQKRRINNHNKGQKKKKSVEKFWIESCIEKRPNNPKVLKNAIHLWITRVELLDDHPSAIAKISPSFDPTEGEHENEDKLVIPTSKNNQSLPICSGGSPVATASIASDNEDDLHSTSTTSANVQGTKGIEEGEGGTVKRPEPFVCVHIHPSAKKKLKWQVRENSSQPYIALPNGDCGDGIPNPYSPEVVPHKYWAQRRRLFSKFDQGIQLDAESWYSVTPEVIAHHTAQRLVTAFQRQQHHYYPDTQPQYVVLDAFCGCGGNAIAFALQPSISLVVCIDIDKNKLQMLATNASIYGVQPSKILLLLGDARHIMKNYYKNGNLIPRNDNDTKADSDEAKEAIPTSAQFCQVTSNTDIERKSTKNDPLYPIRGIESLPLSIHAIYLSPPWGGPTYIYNTTHKKNKMAMKPSLSLQEDMADAITLLKLASHAIDQNIIYFLPKNIHGISVGKAVATLSKSLRRTGIELEQNFINGKLKTVTAYIGMSKFKV